MFNILTWILQRNPNLYYVAGFRVRQKIENWHICYILYKNDYLYWSSIKKCYPQEPLGSCTLEWRLQSLEQWLNALHWGCFRSPLMDHFSPGTSALLRSTERDQLYRPLSSTPAWINTDSCIMDHGHHFPVLPHLVIISPRHSKSHNERCWYNSLAEE